MMTRASTRPAVARLVIVTVSALVLAGCATAAVVAPSPRLEGTPSLSISVPLTQVGCTLDDVCAAFGASATSEGPAAVGEFKTARSPWINLALPAVVPPVLSALACGGTTCLVGGSSGGADLLWQFDALAHKVTVASAPQGGSGVDALACGASFCALIDVGDGAVPRLSFLASDATSWSVPVELSWAKGDAITSLACSSATTCVVSALDDDQRLVVEATASAGATWAVRSTPSAWTTLSSLTCQGQRCVGLAGTSGDSLVVRTTALGKSWRDQTLPARASALACTSVTSCVAVGQRAGGEPWLATIERGTTSKVTLRYVPTPLLDTACGTKVCAAIGVTTLVAWSLPLSSAT